MGKTLAIMFVFGAGTLVLLAFSPLGRAIADRIRGRSGKDEVRAAFGEHRDEIQAELEGVRRDVAELAERLDFAERLLAKSHDVERLAPPRGS